MSSLSSSSGQFIDWPSDLPTPLSVGREHTFHARSETAVMETNRRRTRPIYTETVQVLDVQWNFTGDQYSDFVDFFRDGLNNGVYRFEMETLEPSPVEGDIYEVTRYLSFLDGTYEFTRTDNLVEVRATLLVEHEEKVSIANPATHDQQMHPPPEISSTGTTPECNDELLISLPPIANLQNVKIQYGPTSSGPWTFWGETRQAESEIALSNYFTGYWIRIVAETLTGSFVHAFQPNPPAVQPPSFSAQTHHLDQVDFVATSLSDYALVYEADSPLEVGRKVAGVYPGNLTDPQTGRVAYTVPLFSSAFVEVGPRYSLDVKTKDDGDTNLQVKLTFTAEDGATVKCTTDGTDPTLLNGEEGEVTINPFQDNPKPRSVVIARAFKDGCKSPPLYILIDFRRTAITDIDTRTRNGTGSSVLWCRQYIWIANPEPATDCHLETWNIPGSPSSDAQVSPCPQPSNPTVDIAAILDAFANAGGDSSGGLLIQDVVSDGINWITSDHYDGPDPGTCPSGPWGGGRWASQASVKSLLRVDYTLQADYASAPTQDLYLVETTMNLDGDIFQIPDPASDESRQAVTSLAGPSGSSNNLGSILFDYVPHSTSIFHGEYESVIVVQTCCNN